MTLIHFLISFLCTYIFTRIYDPFFLIRFSLPKYLNFVTLVNLWIYPITLPLTTTSNIQPDCKLITGFPCLFWRDFFCGMFHLIIICQQSVVNIISSLNITFPFFSSASTLLYKMSLKVRMALSLNFACTLVLRCSIFCSFK